MKDESETNVRDKKKKERAPKRPLLNFYDLGLKIGDVLLFKPDQRIHVTIADGTHVEYNGNIMALTPITKKLKKTDNSLQPSPFWIEKKTGKLLSKLYEEKYPR